MLYLPDNEPALDIPDQEIAQLYGGNVRVRACGLCIQDQSVLLINHSLYGKDQPFWSPPGGGVEFGEPAAETVAREFREEAGVDVKVGKLLFVHEHIQPPLHAIELFFEIEAFTGEVSVGSDPESQYQMIREVRFLPFEEIKKMPATHVHAFFSRISKLSDLFELINLIVPQGRI